MAEEQESLKLEWTQTAEEQLRHVLEYWINRNKSTVFAEKLTEAVWEKTSFILQHPQASVQTSFPDIRKAALGHFSIIYKITPDKILIMAFWDNRQNPMKLYKLLKKGRK